MTDTGWRLPTGNTQVSGSWTNPTNIYNETVNYAQIAIAAKNVVYELAGTTFGFSTSIIPDDAIIDTVNFRYRSYQSSTTQASTGGQPYLGATAGTEHTQDTGSATTLTWDATAERPGGGDWQPADFRDGTLTVRLRAKQGNTNTSRTYYFDYVEVQVIFHTPIVWDGAAKFDGVGDFQADAEVPVIWDGAAKFDGVGDFQSDANVDHYVADGAALIEGVGGLLADTSVITGGGGTAWDGAAQFDAVGDLKSIDDTVLLLHFDGDFIDAVGRHQVLFKNTPTIVTDRFKFGDSSLFVNAGWAENDGLQITGSESDFAFGTGDFCIDLWVINNQGGPPGWGTLFITGNTDSQVYLQTNGNGVVSLGVGGGRIVGTTQLAQFVPYHIALTRASGQTRLFVQGVQEGITLTDNTDYDVLAGYPLIGTNTGYQNWQGWIDEVHVIKGRSVWTENFTPPELPYPGGIFISHYAAEGNSQFDTVGNLVFGAADVALLLHGSDFTDSTGKHAPPTLGGSVSIDTTQFKFDGASFNFTGAGGRIQFDGSDDFAFGTGDFTVDFWTKLTTQGWRVFYDGNPSGDISDNYPFRACVNGGAVYIGYPTRKITGTTTLQVDIWYHIALTRSASNLRLFVDGIQEGGTYTDNTNYLTGSLAPAIGTRNLDYAEYLIGRLDELRVIKGRAAWTEDFEPPTASYELGVIVLHPQTWDGNALLVGDSGLAVDTSITHAGAAEFDGATDFKVDATKQGPGAQTWDGNALLAGAGGLLIDATVSHYIAPGAGLLAGAGGCAVDTTVSHYLALGAGLLSGTGTVLSDAVVTHYVADGSAQFIGVGGFLVAGIHTPNGLAKLDGAGALLADSYIKGMIQASAALAGAGGLPVDATVSHYVANGAGLLAGVGAFPVDATVLHYLVSGAGLLSGAGNLLSDATITHYVADGSAKFIGAGGFLVAGTHTPDGASRFNGAGALLVDSYIKGMIQASAALPGVGIFVSDATVLHYVANGSALLAGVGLAQLDVTVLHYVASGASLLTGAGNLLSDAAITHYVADGSAKFTGVGGFLVASIHTPDAASRFNGAGNFLADSYIKGMIQANAALAGAGGFKADVSHTPVGTALLAGVGNFVGDASFKGVILGNALFAGTGNVTARATIIDTAAAARFDGAGNFVAPVGSYLLTRSSFAGIGHLYVDTITRVTHWAEIRFDGVGVLRAAIKLKGYDPIRKPGAYLQGVVQTETDLITVVGTETDLTGTVSSDL